MSPESKKQNFSSEALREAKKLSYCLDENLFEGREEAKGVTIDSAHSKDLDDAIAVEKTSDGWIVHVSIADVSALVKEDSYLDKEAFKKVFTRYFKGSNDPLLPHVLSENMLSLLENEKRPTLTFSIPVSKDFEIGEPTFSKTYLKNQKRFTYDGVDKILKHKNAQSPHKGMLHDAQFVAGNIKKRHGNTAHTKGSPSHLIVQEFMLLANEALAKYCDDHDIPILFRNQGNGTSKPQVFYTEKEKEKDTVLGRLRKSFFNQYTKIVLWCDKKNIPLFRSEHVKKIRKQSQEDFLVEVRNAQKNPEQEKNSTLQKAVDSVIRAEYSPESSGHEGLQMESYTHGTSPIRRYADLVNHRVFSALADHPEETHAHLPYTKEELQKFADQINLVTEKEKKQGKKKTIHTMPRPQKKQPSKAA